MFSNDTQKAIGLFKEFSADKIDANVLEYDEQIRWKDSEAKAFIKKISSVQNPAEIQNFNKELRDDLIRECKHQGLSIRQIERLTGISFGVVRKL